MKKRKFENRSKYLELKGITVTVTATDELESYLADGWQVARDYQIASVQDKLADVLN